MRPRRKVLAAGSAPAQGHRSTSLYACSRFLAGLADLPNRALPFGQVLKAIREHDRARSHWLHCTLKLWPSFCLPDWRGWPAPPDPVLGVATLTQYTVRRVRSY